MKLPKSFGSVGNDVHTVAIVGIEQQGCSTVFLGVNRLLCDMSADVVDFFFESMTLAHIDIILGGNLQD